MVADNGVDASMDGNCSVLPVDNDDFLTLSSAEDLKKYFNDESSGDSSNIISNCLSYIFLRIKSLDTMNLVRNPRRWNWSEEEREVLNPRIFGSVGSNPVDFQPGKEGAAMRGEKGTRN